MKKLIATIAIVIATSTAAFAEPVITIKSKPLCTSTDVAIGVGVGLATSTAIAVGTVAALPLVGPGVAAGSTVGVSGAFSAPILAGTTIPTVVTSAVLTSPMYGFTAYAVSCAVNSTGFDDDVVEYATKSYEAVTEVAVDGYDVAVSYTISGYNAASDYAVASYNSLYGYAQTWFE